VDNLWHHHSIEGCISTGKEANVYYASKATGDTEQSLAIKVYKTSILVFKVRLFWGMGVFLSSMLPPPPFFLT
jgi:RIO kinase 1